jgi:hypothetical protein
MATYRPIHVRRYDSFRLNWGADRSVYEEVWKFSEKSEYEQEVTENLGGMWGNKDLGRGGGNIAVQEGRRGMEFGFAEYFADDGTWLSERKILVEFWKGTEGCFIRTDVLAASSTLIYCTSSSRRQRSLVLGNAEGQGIWVTV